MMTDYRKKTGSVLLAVLLGVSGLANSFAFAAFAEEAETEAETGTATEILAETEIETETEAAVVEPTEIEVAADGETVVVTNSTGLAIVSVAFEEASAENTESEETESGEAETEVVETEAAESADSEASALLVVTEADGTTHTLEDVDFTGLTNLTLVQKIGFLFLTGTDGSGESTCFYEVAEDVVLDEPVTMYTTGMVNIREEADGSSTLLGSADRGSEVQVLGGTSKWFQVTQGDITGYVAARYLTENAE
ncbi:MAG: SH3 domain-containing protein, partial [Lachnospiraceae bacterium]|nr:SH3 domain-containing protein [Lachnospiraceae bacterium]